MPDTNSRTSPSLRDQTEIQKAHDLFIAIALGEIKHEWARKIDKTCFYATLDCLCWVLRHENNPAFAENLSIIEKEVKAKGYERRFRHSPFDDLNIDL